MKNERSAQSMSQPFESDRGERGIMAWARLTRRMVATAAILAASLLAVTPSHAIIGAVDEVPAATLLFPYFEVNLSDPNGSTSILSVTNTSATAILAHAVVWSDLGVPVLAFNMYLTGYDTESINMRTILTTGVVPRTASAGQDPTDTISPKGSHSQDINFASCNGQLPYPPIQATWAIPTSTTVFPTSVDSLQKELTGKQSSRFFNLTTQVNCVGIDHGDMIARGYITVDTVNNCTSRFPGDVGYFGPGGTGDATNQNVMVGDYIIFNTTAGTLQMSNAAHIEASATNAATSTANRYTFYGRYDGTPWNASDNREPLATNYVVMGANGQTDMQVWRDSKAAYSFTSTSFSCPAASGPAPNAVPWYPLGQEGFVAIGTQEDQLTVGAGAPFKTVTGRYSLGAALGDIVLPATTKLGWFYSDLNTTIVSAGGNPTFDPAAAQGFVTAVRRVEGGSSPLTSGATAVIMDSGTAANHTLPN